MDDFDQKVAERLGESLRRHRKLLRWTQGRLAEGAELSVNHISYIERGERLPSVPVLLRLARALGASVGELLGQDAPSEREREATTILRSLSAESFAAALSMLRGLSKGVWGDPPAQSKTRTKKPTPLEVENAKRLIEQIEKIRQNVIANGEPEPESTSEPDAPPPGGWRHNLPR
jgi:transcriptional regulator with XRE-family HTH domain